LIPSYRCGPQRRWDLHAERYAAAVTLHELVAGVPPIWGDGATEPLVTEDEATIATDRFDPTLREGLRDFFTKALRRNAEERFGNAEDMLREWRRAFEPLDRGAIAEDSIETIARRLDRRSTIAELGYGVEARDVLDRMGLHTVHHLIRVDCKGRRRSYRQLAKSRLVSRRLVECLSNIHSGRHKAICGALFIDIPYAREGEVIADERELILHRHVENPLSCL
jgi:hypothetical protein